MGTTSVCVPESKTYFPYLSSDSLVWTNSKVITRNGGRGEFGRFWISRMGMAGGGGFSHHLGFTVFKPLSKAHQ